MKKIGRSISVILPVYNSGEILPLLIEELSGVLSETVSKYEIILVNDGSSDSSWSRVCTEASARRYVRGINLTRNYGQHNALLAGIRAAENEIIVTMDDDMQHPPAEIPALITTLESGPSDVVYGTPIKQHHGFWRVLASVVTKIVLQGAMGATTARSVSPFRAFYTSLRSAFDGYSSPFVSIDVLLTWATTRFSSITVEHLPRARGRSNYTLRRLFTHALNMMTGFSVLPLQLASLMGLTFAGFGIIVLVYVVGRYFVSGGSVPGFPFLASIIAIFSGAQLFALGIIGEYLSRIHFRMLGKPAYTIRCETGRENSEGGSRG